MRFGLPAFLFFAFIDIFTRNATNPADGFLLFSYTVQHIVDCARTCVCVWVRAYVYGLYATFLTFCTRNCYNRNLQVFFLLPTHGLLCTYFPFAISLRYFSPLTLAIPFSLFVLLAQTTWMLLLLMLLLLR